ncbi:MAG: phosphotransferase [Acidimicrobiia bacterium]|nr:phosphotransferase [Acidimicrobiia bacterium]
MREELDFRTEARNLADAAAIDVGHGRAVEVPAAVSEITTRRVLVMARLRGVPVAAAGPLIDERGLDRQAMAGDLLGYVLHQVLHTRLFHADPHPGNVLVLDDGRLALLDFGSVGRLDALTQAALVEVLLALERNDAAGLTDALLTVVRRPDDLDAQGLERALGAFMARHLGGASAPSAEMLVDLVRVVAQHGLAVPAEVAAVFRSLTTLEGTLALLVPGYDVVGAARSRATAQFASQLGAESLPRLARHELGEVLPMLRRLPRRLDRIASALEQERFTANVRLFADARDRRFVAKLVEEVLLAFVGAVAGVMAVVLLATTNGPTVTENVTFLQLVGYHLLVISAVILLRGIFRASRRGD